MTFEIHYTINGVDDYYVLSGETMDEILEQNNIEMEKRNLDFKRNNCWSRQV